MQYAPAIVLFAVLAFPIRASANDAIASVSAGGIVLGKTDAVAMKKEVLNVSHRLISVDYEFVNESAVDVEETVIFPLPAYPAAMDESDAYYGQPGHFSIKVDGQPVRFKSVVYALLGGEDITPQLRKLGLSDAQIAYHPDFGKVPGVARLSAQQRQQLKRLHLLGDGPMDDMEPLWDVQVNYVWRQKFPSRRVVRVHHAYRPFVATGPGETVMDEKTQKRYCTDSAFMKSYDRLGQDGEEYVDVRKVSYILKSANTWKNGIEDFTLNLIKEKPSELVSLCFPGKFKKIDDKTYQVRLRNFKPTRDLEVYFGSTKFSGGASTGQMPVVNK